MIVWRSYTKQCAPSNRRQICPLCWHKVQVAFCISHIQLQLLWETGSPACSYQIASFRWGSESFPEICAPLAEWQRHAPGCRACSGPWVCFFPSPNTSPCWQQGQCLSSLQQNAVFTKFLLSFYQEQCRLACCQSLFILQNEILQIWFGVEV